MRTDDLIKLKKAGYTILSAVDYPDPGIFTFELGDNLLVNILNSEDGKKATGYWKDLCRFNSIEERDHALAKMLEDDKTLLD